MDAPRTEAADDASTVYSDDTDALGDIDLRWIQELDEFSEFYPDYPTTIRTRIILKSGDSSGGELSDPAWARDERLVVDNNGVLSNSSLIHQLDSVLSLLRAKTRQTIEVEDIRLFECVVGEDDMERYMATRDNVDGFSDSICRQRAIRYMKDDIQLRQGISFFHLLNTLIVVLRMRPKGDEDAGGDGDGGGAAGKARTRRAARKGARRGTRKLR
jgi:hypothetical protein